MLISIDLAAKGRALQRPGAEIEGEAYERIELSVGQWYVDEPQYRSHGGTDVVPQQFLTDFVIDPVREPLPLVVPHHVPVPNGRPAGRADVDRRAKPLEPTNEIEPVVGDVSHGR